MSSTTSPLSDSEFRELLALLCRFAETDLDQSDNWRFGTSFGEVFVSVARAPAPGANAEVYTDMTRLLAEE